MSTALVRAALCSLLTDADRECLQSVSGYRQAKEEVRQFLEVITQDDERLCKFDAFSLNLMKMLEKCFFSCVSKSSQSCRSKCVKREKMWSAFHQLRIKELSKIWQDLFGKQGFPKLNPSVYQFVNQKLYMDLISSHISAKIDNNPVEIPALTVDEENILRYVAGYIPYKLLKRYEKNPSTNSAGIIECLSAMAVNGDESDCLTYTTHWISCVNRGGLFEISDNTYTFFTEIEVRVRKQLLIAFDRKATEEDLRESIIDSVASDEDVQFYWTILSVDIEREDQATLVLKQIIGLWLTVRGFSIAGKWMDQYLQISKQSTSKTKGLRTELKRATPTPENMK